MEKEKETKGDKMKKEYYRKLDILIDNYIANKKGIYEIITLVKKMLRLNIISNYKLKQVNKLCNIKINKEV
jgi:hypothetical protein